MKNKTAVLQVFLCLSICAFILNLKSAFIYPEGFISAVNSIGESFLSLMAALKLSEEIEFLRSLTLPVCVLGIGIITAVAGYFILSFFTRKIEFSCCVISKKFSEVIKNGLLAYFAVFVLVCVFMYSVIGFPVAVLILVVSTIVCFLGFVPVAVYLGGVLQEVLNGNDRRIIFNYIIGSILILFCINVQVVGTTFWVFVFPVLSMGTMVTVLEKVYTKEFDFMEEPSCKRSRADREKIKSIITKDLD